MQQMLFKYFQGDAIPCKFEGISTAELREARAGEIVLSSRFYNCDNYGFCPKTLLYGRNNPQVVLIVSNRVINLIYSFIYTEHIRNYLIFILGWITQGWKRNVEGGNCSFICFNLFLPKTILIGEGKIYKNWLIKCVVSRISTFQHVN